MNRFQVFFSCLTLFIAAGYPCAGYTESIQYALSMYGSPKYPANFSAFDYVNADAPKGGTLHLGSLGSFDSLNPFIVGGQSAHGISGGPVSALIYQSLMARSQDEPFTLYGLIAESVEVADDRSSIIFNLNTKAHWSDGSPLTADDVEFSYKTLRDKGRPNHRTYYKKVASVEKLSPSRIKFTFKPNADGTLDREMPLIMGLMPIIPAHDWADRAFNQTTRRIPIGSGPYVISKFDLGHSINFTRDKNYWGKDLPSQRGLYNFDEIRIDYYRDDSIALQAFKAGQFDLRRETDPNKWATAYDTPAVSDGRIKLEKLEHHRTEPIQGFVLNARNEFLKDQRLRAALEYTFDSGWVNRNLFHGQYKRTESFFPNSELAAPLLPDDPEKQILERYLANDKAGTLDLLLTAPVREPSTDGSEESLRGNLKHASEILKNAGYVFEHGLLFSPAGQPVSFEILLSDPSEEKIALTWRDALKRLGIIVRIHTVDSSQYQQRASTFTYDITTARWFNSLSPGNEQISYWGSQAADQPGSRNYAGVKNPIIDALANAVPASSSRDNLVITTHALDRMLMAGHYVIPFYYLGADDIAWWTPHLDHPPLMPLYGTVLESWWAH